MSTSRALLAALAAVVAAAALTSCSAGTPPVTPRAAVTTGYHGPEPVGAAARPSFTLTDTKGQRYDFGRETGGRPTLLYFGYVNCPDECPTAMADIQAALRRQPAAVRDAVRVVFVSTDPARDTLPLIRQFLDQWSISFVGLTGTPAEVAVAAAAAGAESSLGDPQPTLSGQPDAHVEKPGTAPHKHFGPLGYAVTHSDVIFAYDTSDRLPVVYPGGSTPSDIAADLPVLASKKDRP